MKKIILGAWCEFNSYKILYYCKLIPMYTKLPKYL